MKVYDTLLAGVRVFEPQVFGDARGFFMESWQQQRYAATGLQEHFVQDNLSFSQQGVLRGLHYQSPRAQGKLVSVLQGEVFDVAVDIRRDSQTFGQWHAEILSSDNHRQLYIPPGFAHGFCVTSATALLLYKCTEFYYPEEERVILWNDGDLAINWPLQHMPQLSERDANGAPLHAVPHHRLPTIEEIDAGHSAT